MKPVSQQCRTSHPVFCRLKARSTLGVTASAKKGQLVTVVVYVCHQTLYIPLLTYPRVKIEQVLLDHAAQGAVVAVLHVSGWMHSEILVDWFKHLLSHTNPTSESPVLLILDGHKTHTLNLEVINPSEIIAESDAADSTRADCRCTVGLQERSWDKGSQIQSQSDNKKGK